MSIRGGFMGYAKIGSTKVRCTDFDVKLVQEALFYDHTIGLRDSIPLTILGGKGDIAAQNKQKVIWRAGTKKVEGSLNFPLTELSATAFLQEACKGDSFDLNLYYHVCDASQIFTDCKVNTYSFTATSGEGANVSVSVIGKHVADSSVSSPYSDPEKIISWDKVIINGTGFDTGIVSFEFAINNNCIPIYTSGVNNDPATPLELLEIRVGMQVVTGSITYYNDLGPTSSFVENSVPIPIQVIADTFNVNLNVLYQYPSKSGQVSAYLRTIPFVGVDLAVNNP